MIKTRPILSFISVLLFGTIAFGQVTISPTSLFVDSQKRFETLLILNPSETPQEVKLTWEFGYPKTNEAGDIKYIYDDEARAAESSAADWIRGFPKNFILEAGARQTIRITVKSPRNIKDGTYWARLRTTSSPVSPPIGTNKEGEVSANITFQFNQVTGVFYQHGDLTTGLEISNVQAEIKNQQLQLFTSYEKSGNSPYLGTLSAKIYDTDGELVLSEQNLVSIYYDGLRRIDLPASDLLAGTYEYEVSFTSGRSDINEQNTISAPPSTARGTFTKP